MTDPQTAANAAERCPTCAATAPYWRPDDRECEICLAVTEVPTTLDELASDAEDGYGADVLGEHVKHLRQKHALLVEHIGTLLTDHARMAAELKQVRGERDALQRLHDGREDDELHACNGGGIMPCSICGEYTPDAEVQKRFQAFVAADMERARQTGVLAEIEAWEDVETATSAAPDATGDTQTAEQRADGKRTPEQWCAEYGIDIADPDGWRNTGDPAWDEPITLPDFLRRAARSTTRGLTPDVWNRLSREAHAAADAEAIASAARGATERGAAPKGSVS